MIEKIQKHATPEVVEALKAGDISLNAAAAVASLPEQEQKDAALAGKEELRHAARRVREGRRKPPAASESAPASAEASAASDTPGDELNALRQRVRALEQENAALREQLARWQAQTVPSP